MKKLFFAAIAMVVMVSVSNVFANGSQPNVSGSLPVDTTTDTVAPTEQATPADSSAETAMQVFSDTTGVETATTDSSNVA